MIRDTKPCPSCGSPRRVRYVEGTRIEVGIGPCFDEYCEEGGGGRRRREGAISAASVVGTAIGIALILFVTWAMLTGLETMARNACEARDGTYVPVRGLLLDWPTGQGTCTP